MTKIEIFEKLKELSQLNDAKELQKELRLMSTSFYALYNEEKKELEAKQLDLEQEITLDPENEKLNKEVIATLDSLKERVKEIKKSQEAEEKENLSQKMVILKRFQLLLQNEENLGVLFNTVKEIREEWKEVGNIPRAKFQEVQNQYSQLNELFNYNVNIYKELQENDLKKNFSLKNQLIHEAKELLNSKAKGIEKNVRTIQQQWDEIGPTFTEHWEKLKEEYWSTIKAIYEKIDASRAEKENEKQDNLEKKKALISQIQEIVSTLPDAHGAWEKMTQQLNELQEQWKKVGFAPKEVNDQIWKEFRGYFDNFYTEKAKFYEGRKSENDEKKTLKEQIIEKADQLKDLTDWKVGTDLIKKLQNDWKNVGHAGQYAEQKLWKTFRAKCDAFFEAKDKYYAELDASNQGNLTLKLALIEEIKAFEPLADAKESLNALKTFAARFAEIGNVPYKEKDQVYKSYKEALDAQYGKLKLSGKEKDKVLFQARLDTMKGASNPSQMFQKEKEFIRKKINDLTKEIANFENNLGFFSNSKGAEALLKGVRDNIQKGKDEIEALKVKLKSINQQEKEASE